MYRIVGQDLQWTSVRGTCGFRRSIKSRNSTRNQVPYTSREFVPSYLHDPSNKRSLSVVCYSRTSRVGRTRSHPVAVPHEVLESLRGSPLLGVNWCHRWTEEVTEGRGGTEWRDEGGSWRILVESLFDERRNRVRDENSFGSVLSMEVRNGFLAKVVKEQVVYRVGVEGE